MTTQSKFNEHGMFRSQGGIEGQRSSETTDPQEVTPAGLENGNQIFSHTDGYIGEQPFAGGPKGKS